MSLRLIRRHSADCKKGYPPHLRAKDMRAGDCSCLIHVEGSLEGRPLRKATGTSSMKRAMVMVVEAEKRGKWDDEPVAEKPTVANCGQQSVVAAVQAFLAECESRSGKNLMAPTMSKYRTLLHRLTAFAAQHGLESLDDINYARLLAFKATWANGPQATANNIVRLRAFWKFCVKCELASRNPAADLEMPADYEINEREPFTDREMEQILNAARTIQLDVQQEATNYELETIILLMRWSGMGISDAALFEASELVGDEARYYRKKTERKPNRRLVVVPLPEGLLERLQNIRVKQGKYFFCGGSTENATNAWHNRLRHVFDAAGVKKAGSHRFRHTAATHWLTKGVPIELVSRYLGHNSITVTVKYYSHWIPERIQAASDVLRNLYKKAS